MRLSNVMEQNETVVAEPTKGIRLSDALSEERGGLELWALTEEKIAESRPLTSDEEAILRQRKEIDFIKKHPTDLYSGVPSIFDAYVQGILPIRDVNLQRPSNEIAHPIATAMGEITGLVVVGALTGGLGPIVTHSKALASLPTVAKFVAGRMAQTGATFGIKEISDNMAEFVAGEKKDFQVVVTDVLTSTGFGAGLGAIGSIASPVARIPAMAGYGYTSAKITGAENFEAGVNAGIFAVFGLFNTKNLSEAYKRSAAAGARQAMVDRMVRHGYDPKKAEVITTRYFNWAIAKNGGWSKQKIKDFDKFSQAMRKGWKIHVEPELKPGDAQALVSVKPKPLEAIKLEKPPEIGVIKAPEGVGKEILPVVGVGVAPPRAEVKPAKLTLPERVEKVEQLEVQLEEITKVTDFLKGGVKRFKGDFMKEELDRFPKGFFTTKPEAMTPDQALDAINTANLGVEFATVDELGMFLAEQDIRVKDIRAEIQKLKPRLVSRKETTIARQRLKDLEAGIRKGRVIAKKEAKVMQNELIALVEAAGLEPKDRAKFLRTIKNTQTKEQFLKILPEIDERIATLQDKAIRRGLIADIKSETQTSKIKKLRPEFRDKIVPLVESIDLTKRKDATIKNLESLAEFIEREPENQVPQKRLNDLKILSKKPIGELTTEDLQLISDSINHFVKLNELKNKLIIKGKLREAREITNKAVVNVSKKHQQLNESLSGLDSFQQEQEASLWNKIFGADSYNAELKSEILDGADHDTIMSVVFNEVDDGVAEGFKFKHSTEDFFKEKLKGINTDKWSHSFQTKSKNVDKVEIKISDNRTITMTKGEAIAFNLHVRNERNSKHLAEGGFAFVVSPSKIIKLTGDDILKIADSVKGDMLTVADAMHEHFNTHQKVAINKVSVDLLGHEVAVEPDYFPIRTDFLDRFKDELIKTGNYSQKTLEGMGMFKERQNASNAIILEDAFVATYKSIESASAYIGLAKPLRGAKTLLNDNDFQIAARNAGLNNYVESLKDYIRRVEGESLNLDNVDKLTQDLINKVDVAILGPNPFVWFKQPISFLAASTEIDFKYLQKGRLKNVATKAEIAEMRKYSPHIRDRLDGNVTREAGEIAQVGRVKKFFTGKEVLSAKFMKGLRKGDLRAITGIWRAVKAEVSERSPNLKGDAYFEKVAERAWEIVRRTQPTFHVKDRSTIGMSRNVFIRLATKYSSQRNKNYMIVRRAFERYNRSAKTGKDKAKLAKALTIITIISPLLLMAIDELRDRIYAKKEDKRSLLRKITTKYITLNFGNIYFLGPGVNSLISKIEKGTYAGYDINNPLISLMDDLIDTVANAVRSIEQSITGERFKSGKDVGEKKWIASLKKSAVGALDAAGKITGWGIHNLRKWVTGLGKRIFPEKKGVTLR